MKYTDTPKKDNKISPTEVTTSCFSREEFNSDLFELKDNKISPTEVTTSCFSREEFNSDLFELKGTIR